MTMTAQVPEAPVQVTTNHDGDQFVCLNLDNQNLNLAGEAAPSQASFVQSQDLNPIITPQHYFAQQQQQQPQQQLVNFGTIQAPVHSQLVVQRVGTLPRQYAHPLAQL